MNYIFLFQKKQLGYLKKWNKKIQKASHQQGFGEKGQKC